MPELNPLDYWQDLWSRPEPRRFEQRSPHVLLQRFIAEPSHRGGLDLEGVFMPFCGQSVDVDYLLDQGLTVVGNDLCQRPLVEILDRLERGCEGTQAASRDLVRFQSSGLTLIQGDFFHLVPADIASCNLCYDRAGSVVLPPDVRRAFASHLAALQEPGDRYLVLSNEYDEADVPPGSNFPLPFALPDLRSLYAAHYEIEALSLQLEKPPFTARLYLLTRRDMG